jgi:hypothetical protein
MPPELWQKRKPPKWVEKLCASFGSDPIYAKPKYRVIWGPDREEWRHGILCQRYDDVDPRWILEVFVPHSQFGSWDEVSMGPKPPGGEYWLSQIIQVNGEYVSMADYGRETLKLLILVVERGKAVSEYQRECFRKNQEAKKHAAWKKRFSDIYDDAQNPFGENAVAGNPGKRRSDDIVLADMSKLSPA